MVLGPRQPRNLDGERRVARQGVKTDPRKRQKSPKSEFFRHSLPSEAIAALLATFSESWTPGQFRELDFTPWGGAYNRTRPDATAFVHRSERFLLKHAVNPAVAAGQKEAANARVTRSWACVHLHGSGGVFPNFVDPDLENWTAAAYGANAGQLSRVKATYDPAGLFRFS